MYTSKGVSLITGLSIRRIQQWAKGEGKRREGRDYLFTQSDIDRIVDRRGKVGRRGKDA